VVALVIFIVLTFVGIGAAIWLYQQYSILQRAVAANQQAFEQQAASVFQREGWDLSHEVGAEYGFKYDEQAYAQVAQKLNQAAEYEALLALLGWESTNEVQSALDVSPVQDERPDERYSSIAALLGFYEQQYELLTERVRELDAEVAAKQQLIDDKTAALTRTQNELRGLSTESSSTICRTCTSRPGPWCESAATTMTARESSGRPARPTCAKRPRPGGMSTCG